MWWVNTQHETFVCFNRKILIGFLIHLESCLRVNKDVGKKLICVNLRAKTNQVL